MGASLIIDDENREAKLVVDGPFTFELNETFESLYGNLNKKYERYLVDLRQTYYIDSSALSMLLRFNEHVGNNGSRVTILTGDNSLQDILQIARFDKIFHLITE